MTTDEQPTLPGLEPPTATAGPMLKAAHHSIDTLRAAGRITGANLVLASMVVSLADAIDKGARSGRASAVAMAAAQLRETMLILDPPPEDGGDVDALRMLRDFMDKVEAVANGEQP
jgi:hypothetical protein